MKIQMTADGRVLQGTPRQIVQSMQSLAQGQRHRSLAEYIRWLAADIERTSGVALPLSGETDDDLALSFVQALLSASLAQKL